MIIDVSEHQGLIDWEKVKASGVEGAIIRLGYGRDAKNQDDKYYLRNVQQCQKLGIPFGVYLYSYAGSKESARSEADHVKRLIAGIKLDFPIFYDLEEAKYSGVAMDVAKAFLETMKGYDVGIYASLYWFKNYLAGLDCKKWVASWGSSQPVLKNIVLWQYTSTGKVEGISGNVDCNKNIALKINKPEKPANKPSGSENQKVSDTKMPTIKKGSKNKAVKIWQVIVGVDIDGKFGPKTEAATKVFQEKHGLEVDGIVGPKTWKKGLESV